MKAGLFMPAMAIIWIALLSSCGGGGGGYGGGGTTGPYPTLTLVAAHDFAGFDGSGFSPTPAAGQLDSDDWIISGMSDGDMTRGGTFTSPGDFARGASPGGVLTGGVYAFDSGGGNPMLGFQPAGADFNPGAATLRVQNTTGSAATTVEITYMVYVNNDEERSSSLNFAYSLDELSFVSVASLNVSTPAVADTAGFVPTMRSTTLTGLNIAPDGFIYLRWSGMDISGIGGRDEIGIDDVTVWMGS